MKKILIIISFLIVIPVVGSAKEPKDKITSQENGESGPIIMPDDGDKLKQVSDAVLRKIVEATPEMDLDGNNLSTLSTGVKYENGICIYAKMPSHELSSSILRDVTPILEDELKRALNELSEIEGTFSDIKVSAVESLDDSSNNNSWKFFISVDVKDPNFKRDEVSITLDKIIWEVELPEVILSPSNEDSGKTYLEIDKQKLFFINPRIIIDGMEIPLQTTSKNGEEGVKKTFAKLDLHIASSDDIQWLNYDISQMGIESFSPIEREAASPYIRIIDKGEVKCDIKCKRLDALTKEDREEILRSFNKLGSLVWRRLTDTFNRVLANKLRQTKLPSWCLPFEYKNPLLDMPFVGVSPKYPEILTSDTLKLSSAVSFDRCNQGSLQRFSAELINQHESFEDINEFLSSLEGRESIKAFIHREKNLRWFRMQNPQLNDSQTRPPYESKEVARLQGDTYHYDNATRNWDAMALMHSMHLDALMTMDIDIMNLIFNGLSPELGKEYIYMIPSRGADGDENEVTFVGGERYNFRNIFRDIEVQFGIPVSAEVTYDGELTPFIHRDPSGKPVVWGVSPILPDMLVQNGLLKRVNRSVVPYDDKRYVVGLASPKKMTPHHRGIYVSSMNAGSEANKNNFDYFSVEAKPTSLLEHFIKSPEGVVGRIIQESELFNYVKPSMFIVRDGKLMVGFVYEDKAKDKKE